MSELAAEAGGVPGPMRRRIAAASLAAVIVLGSGLLWVGVPIAGFWLGGQVTTTAEDFLVFVLGVVPLSMVLVGFGLYRVNARYEALRRSRPGRPPLIDVAMATSAVAALVLMAVWFFFLAEMRLVNPL